MPKFSNAFSALRWALFIIEKREGAKAQNYDPDLVGQKTMYGDYDFCDAISIKANAENVCREEMGCWHDPHCLRRWVMPHNGEHHWTDREKARIGGCLKELEYRLERLRFIDRDAGEEE